MSVFSDLSDFVGDPGPYPPSREVVEWLHANAPQDRDDDMHHQLGTGPTHAARGNHDHDGKNSAALFKLSVLPAAPASSSNADLYNALVAVLGQLRARSS